VSLPGSKSLTARYLVLAALAQGPSVIEGALRARDTDLMAAALRRLGAKIHTREDGAVQVSPGPLVGAGQIDAGLAGTVMRFLPPVAALARGETRFTGDPAAARRPIAPLLDALEGLGVRVRPDSASAPGGGSLPFEILGRGAVAGGPVRLDASASSQFLSALLLAAPRFDQGVDVILQAEPGGKPPLPSRPHVDMTVEALRTFGARVDQGPGDRWTVHPGGLTGRAVAVEPDLTNAAPFLAAALAAGGTVRVAGWPERTTQAGALMLDCLRAFGAEPKWEQGLLAVTGPGAIRGASLDLANAGELAPVAAALAALAEGESRVRGIGHLRGHETDRLAALARELNRLGADAEETPDGLVIRPKKLRGGLVRTYGDHRMAMFGAVLGLRVAGVELEDVGVTAKTFPTFPALWEALL
jgi:3-phosphoshikimate 1-carboxyvinyltransferase